ncbi:hypothetical protein AX16_001413 [Volvariella volvacea WC 439]|nr:hypothetical protein AX16_001413 [Volvariella volvacea WC 439]
MSNYPSLEELVKEHKELVFRRFTAETAWTLGCILREVALEVTGQSGLENPVAIRIIHTNGQILFSTFTRTGTIGDAESWLKRKAATVFRWGTSSLYVGSKIRAKGGRGKLVSEDTVADDREYACHGGGFPVRVEGVEGVIAAVVISGLPETEDHRIAVEGIRRYVGTESVEK